MTAGNTEHYYESHDWLKLFYKDYSPANASGRSAIPAICLPGLTRNSRDFDELAAHLARHRRVLAPDLRGRGFSEHDAEWRNYHPGTYVKDTWTLLDTLGIERIIVIGTSLGGLMAMLMAHQDSNRLAGVVMNDVGPEIASEGLARIMAYAGLLPEVANWHDAVAQTREVYGQAWPTLDDDEWKRMAQRAYRENADGVPVQDIDRNIGRAIREVGTQTGDPWQLFDALRATPTLLLHGTISDILTQPIIDKMLVRKPDLQVVHVPDRGHVPILNEKESVSAIDRFIGEL